MGHSSRGEALHNSLSAALLLFLTIMTHPMDDFFYPRPKRSQGLHTQESGDAGLSSNMEHTFSDDYNENASPVADKGSFVIPIPKEELDNTECFGMAEEEMQHPSVFRPPPSSNTMILSLMGHTKPESHSVVAEEPLLDPSTLVLEKKNIPPQATLIEKGPEEKTVHTLPGTTTISEGEVDTEVEGEEKRNMDTGVNPVKPRGHHRKRSPGRNWKWFLAFILITHVSMGFAAQCFTCMDREKCPHLLTIYDPSDTLLFSRDPNQALPNCSAVFSPPSMSCTVCCDQTNVTIYCSVDVGEELEVEASDGSQIENISPVCEQQPRGRAHVGLISSPGLFLIVIGALVI
ncbi:uncharacterized protein LOC108899419 isoform X2 [Lates calcarifer]|uniref:Uncharacterized protein LOC108899419 isoform X2 n=1 Tax=Lates calcarifer TaxID=8187 RepID=A0AAJ7QGM8_LATCA|nr:uncharacterized protein LOC108899419 isoform X2 [Lates calcarifer]